MGSGRRRRAERAALRSGGDEEREQAHGEGKAPDLDEGGPGESREGQVDDEPDDGDDE